MAIPEWLDTGANVFSSIGTVGAFAVAMYLLREEHQREALNDEEARRSQAVKVSAWIEARALPHGGREVAFHVHNASDMPIFEVSLPMPIPNADEGRHEAEFIGLVPPGQTIQRAAPSEWAASYFSPEPVEIEFLDSGGRHWTRDEQGSLTREDQQAETQRSTWRSRLRIRGRRRTPL
jgi:hypothetical protein